MPTMPDRPAGRARWSPGRVPGPDRLPPRQVASCFIGASHRTVLGRRGRSGRPRWADRPRPDSQRWQDPDSNRGHHDLQSRQQPL